MCFKVCLHSLTIYPSSLTRSFVGTRNCQAYRKAQILLHLPILCEAKGGGERSTQSYVVSRLCSPLPRLIHYALQTKTAHDARTFELASLAVAHTPYAPRFASLAGRVSVAATPTSVERDGAAKLSASSSIKNTQGRQARAEMYPLRTNGGFDEELVLVRRCARIAQSAPPAHVHLRPTPPTYRQALEDRQTLTVASPSTSLACACLSAHHFETWRVRQPSSSRAASSPLATALQLSSARKWLSPRDQQL